MRRRKTWDSGARSHATAVTAGCGQTAELDQRVRPTRNPNPDRSLRDCPRRSARSCPQSAHLGKLSLLYDVVRAFPNRELHVVVDNLNIHKNDAAQRWLARHPPVHFHDTPTHASWLNLIECFFSTLSKQGLAHSGQHSKQHLKQLLHRFLASYNPTCNPFTWTKGPEHLQRIIETTKDYQALHPKKPRRRRAKRKQADSIRN
jgi:transposase